jgi:hypothetical protein
MDIGQNQGQVILPGRKNLADPGLTARAAGGDAFRHGLFLNKPGTGFPRPFGKRKEASTYISIGERGQ